MSWADNDLDRRLSIIFVPSPNDISDYRGSDSYGWGLREVREEIDGLVSEVAATFYASEDKEEQNAIPQLHRPITSSAGNMPDLLFQLGLALSSGTVSVIFFKLVENWVKHRNGRKFRVRLPTGFEVEASQLSEEDFSRLFQILFEKYSQRDHPSARELKAEGFSIVDQDERFETMAELNEEYQKKCSEILTGDNELGNDA